MSEHYISIDPRIMSGAPCVHHRRIPATTLGARYLAGESIDEIAEDFDLHRNDVLVAVWYLGIYGRLKRWRVWRKWAQGIEGLMWAGSWDTVSDPPRGTNA